MFFSEELFLSIRAVAKVSKQRHRFALQEQKQKLSEPTFFLLSYCQPSSQQWTETAMNRREEKCKISSISSIVTIIVIWCKAARWGEKSFNFNDILCNLFVPKEMIPSLKWNFTHERWISTWANQRTTLVQFVIHLPCRNFLNRVSVGIYIVAEYIGLPGNMTH